MSEDVTIYWANDMTQYDFGAQHPMSPLRVALTMRLAADFGLLDLPHVRMVEPTAVPEPVLLKVHTPEYVAAVKQAGAAPETPLLDFGLGTEDNPTFPDMHEATARIVGASVAAAMDVWEGRAQHAVNIVGGLHHGMPGMASGFCVYNDVAVAIRELLDSGVERIAYVDIDVHHGDGVQAIFYDDPRVLTISLHESPRTLFPGTGFSSETGGTGAETSAVNVPLPPGTGDRGWLRAFHAVVPHLVRAFEPEILVTQHGCDSHVEDPLAHLALTVDCQRSAYAALHSLAHEVCEGRWLVTGGGGYAVVDVVPRAWTHLISEVVGRPIDPTTPLPETWRSLVERALGHVPPTTMTDGGTTEFRSWETGYDPGDWLDGAILEARRAVFPGHGLDPEY
jgi:acetoin utilization protein AcuC